MRLIRYMCINFLVIAFEKRLIRHMFIDLLEIAFEKRLIRHMYIIFIGKLSSFPAKRRMHMHFALPRVAFAYTWSRKVPHFSVSQSDCECFPIEYCTLCLSTPRMWLCTVSTRFEFHGCYLAHPEVLYSVSNSFEFHGCPLVDLSAPRRRT